MVYYGSLSSVLDIRADAVAFIDGNEEYSSVRGMVMFYSVHSGVVVRAEITGLPQGSEPCGSPIFAFHIHSGGSCTGMGEDDFADTGTHYNPDGCPHPYHAGDLTPLFGAGGNVFSVFLTDRFTLSEVIGKAIIIHSDPDDFTTQPSGNSGEKIACGIIMPMA